MHGPLATLHVAAAVAALGSGLLVILWRKGRAVHRMVGLAYVFAMLMTNISALMIYRLNGHFNLFHVFALLSLFYTLIGLAMPIVRPRNWLNLHVQWMGWSYLSLLAAALNELLIRLPLQLDTPMRTLAVGAAIGVVLTACGLGLRPNFRRAAQRFASPV
jgi:uncharacterized membrane protein